MVCKADVGARRDQRLDHIHSSAGLSPINRQGTALTDQARFDRQTNTGDHWNYELERIISGIWTQIGARCNWSMGEITEAGIPVRGPKGLPH